jgi:hypothetical protein
MSMNNRIRAGALSLLAAAVLAGCGGGGGGDAPLARGTILSTSLTAQASTADIDAGSTASGLRPLAGAAVCNVDVRYVQYATRDPAGAYATTSGAVYVPSGTAAQCSGSRPVVLYAHGTTTSKTYNLADISRNATSGAFNNAAGGEASLLMAMYAAQGFIVVAPNYLGYDTSSLNYHPYLNAEAQAVDMVDGLRAARTLLENSATARPSSKLFVTGYSQGGHVAMATHKAIERDYASEIQVTASVPMSGPYNLVTLGDITSGPGPINAGATIFAPLLITSYQRSYGNLYANPAEVYQQPFAATAEGLLPSTTSVSQLVAEGKLPADPTFTRLFGTGGLLTDSFRAGYMTSNYRNALVRNTLAGMNGNTPIVWRPQRPMALCGGANDPTVFWAPNGPVAQQLFASQGVTVQAWNLEDRASLPAGAAGDAVFAGFQQAKAAAGANLLAQYHGGLVPPFCNALARGLFSAL